MRRRERASSTLTSQAAGHAVDDEQLRHRPRWPWSAARGRWSGTSTASPMWTCWAASRSTLLGHAHPAVVAAVTRQIGRWGTCPTCTSPSRRWHSPSSCLPEPAGRARSSLPTPAPRRTRRRSSCPAPPAGPRWSPPTGSFHGRTMGALALTGQPAKADPFRPLPGEVTHVPYGDVDALHDAVDRRHRDGDPGADPGRERRDRAAGRLPGRGPGDHQCARLSAGAGRGADRHRPYRPLVRPSGRRDRAPDVVTLAKGLGGGLPTRRHDGLRTLRPTLLGPGSHGSTFGGNPVVLRRRARGAGHDRRGGPARPREADRRAAPAWHRGVSGIRCVAEVRGAGLLLGIVLTAPVSACARRRALQTAGFLTNAVQPDAIRLAPPLILTAEQADAFVAALPGALATAVNPLWMVPTSRPTTSREPTNEALPARRRPEPGRAGRGARPGAGHEGRPVRVSAAGRAAGGGGAVRQAEPAHPALVRGGHRRAGRPADHRGQPEHPLRPGRDAGRRGPGAVPVRQRRS